MILSDGLIRHLIAAQLQTQQVMTSQISSHIEYLIQTYYIFCWFCSQNLFKKFTFWQLFNTISWWYLLVAYFFGPPCISCH